MVENNNSVALNNSNTFSEDEVIPLWRQIMDYSQLAMTITGFLANLVTLITLSRNKAIFSEIIRLLLMNQSCVDCVACLFASILILQTPLWVPGDYALASFICHAWHSQTIYWTFMAVSIWNLVAIAAERWYSVCHPLKHNSLTKGKTYVLIAGLYAFGAFCLLLSYFQTHMSDGACVSGYLWQGAVIDALFKAYSIFSFCVFYALPFILFFVLYGMVVLTLKRRKSQSDFRSNRVIDEAANKLTKTALIVTVMFIICLGFDLWYYVLAYNGVVPYILNSPVQKVGVWLASMNTTCNPFIYAMFMPVYRKCVVKTFCGCAVAPRDASSRRHSDSKSESGSNQTNVSAIS